MNLTVAFVTLRADATSTRQTGEAPDALAGEPTLDVQNERYQMTQARFFFVVLVAQLVLAAAANAIVWEVDYDLNSPLADSQELAPGFWSSKYSTGISGIALGIHTGGPFAALGSTGYGGFGRFRSARVSSVTYSEVSLSFGLRKSLESLWGLRLSVGAGASLSRYWRHDGSTGTRSSGNTNSVGNGLAFLPEVQVAYSLGGEFAAVAAARGVLYISQPDPHGIVFPFESGLVVSVGVMYGI